MSNNYETQTPVRFWKNIWRELEYRNLHKGPGSLLSLLLVACLLLGGCNLLPARTSDQSTMPESTTAGATGQTTPEGTTQVRLTPMPPISRPASPSPAPTAAPSPTARPSPTAALSPTIKPSPSAAPKPTSTPANRLADEFFGPLPVPSVVRPVSHNQVRALYVGAARNLAANLEIARQTEINTLVIDLKESDAIYFACSVKLAREIGAVREAYDLQAVVERCHAAGVKVIGRIVCFKDLKLAAAKPEYCIRDANGTSLVFGNEGGLPFVSPYNQAVWQYNIDIALNALDFGIDEIQFDYVRFPTGSARGGATPYFGTPGEVPDKVQAINRFLQTARIKIQDERGIPLGADVFAIILTSRTDGRNIGQSWATIGLTGIDSISPMIYPSHYANSSTGHYTGNGEGTYLNGILYPKPDLKPYEVMYNVLKIGSKSASQNGYAVNRPWLQAFTATYLPDGYYMKYGAKEIRAQIKAIQDAGYQEWICWNASAVYSQSAFNVED